MQVALKSAIHRLRNQMQVVLGHLDIEPKCPLGYPCRDTHVKALKATKAAITLLHDMDAALHGLIMVMPAEGSVVVAPHGSQIVSHDDLIEDVPADEVKVADVTDVTPGEGEHNPRTA